MLPVANLWGKKKGNAGRSIAAYHTKCNNPAVYHIAEELHSYTKQQKRYSPYALIDMIDHNS